MITLGFDLDHMNEAPYKGAYLGNSTNLYANSKRYGHRSRQISLRL